jgi:hypothetical protein
MYLQRWQASGLLLGTRGGGGGRRSIVGKGGYKCRVSSFLNTCSSQGIRILAISGLNCPDARWKVRARIFVELSVIASSPYLGGLSPSLQRTRTRLTASSLKFGIYLRAWPFISSLNSYANFLTWKVRLNSAAIFRAPRGKCSLFLLTLR